MNLHMAMHRQLIFVSFYIPHFFSRVVNEELGTDLPILIRFLDARRHDSVSGIVTLA